MKSFKFDVLRDDVPVRQLMVRGGTSPTISFNGNAVINRTLRIEVEEFNGEQWLTDKIQVSRMNEDGSKTAFGLFVVTTPTYEVDDAGTRFEKLECYDLNYVLSNLSVLEETTTIPAGTSYRNAILAQLQFAGITRVIADDCNYVLPTDKEFEIGTSRYDVINNLLGDINFNPLWFDGEGNAMLKERKPVEQNEKTHRYNERNAIPVYIPMESSGDLFNAANVFIEICNSADIGSTLIAKAENHDFSSPLCIERRKLRIADVETVDSIANAEALQVRANNRLLQSMMSTETYSFTSDGDMEEDHGLFDSMILSRYGIGMLEEQDWSIECVSGGQMKHTGKKVFYSND